MSLFRRSRPSPAPVRDIAEAKEAVGSLAGVAPSEIERHILIVVGKDGTVSVSGTACRVTATLVLAEVLAQYARQSHAKHRCGSRS